MRIANWIVVVMVACVAMQARGQDEGLDLRPAGQAARAWLATVDAGRYGDSWENAAELFKQTIPKLRWETTVQAVREPLGVVVGRKVRAMNYARVLPGAPEGEYVVIQFDTRFENRPLSVETVTPMREKDGSWKVSGYFIR
jgi:hypothetical protein